MNKYYIFCLLSCLILSSCATSKKYLGKGQFDMAISKSVKKLRKNPSNTKEIAVLKEAFYKANQIDKDRINSYKNSNEADAWDNIYKRYSNLKRRQDLIKTLPDKVLNDINFTSTDYDYEIQHAKKKAAEYYYDRADDLLRRNDKYSAREAYYELQKVKQLFKDYRDVDNKIQEALFKGTNNVLFKIQNHTPVVLPKALEEDLLKISLKDLNVLWLNYDTRHDKNVYYDYSILLNLRDIKISPEQVSQETITEQKEVPDGFRYALDSKGNVMKDTAGNDIKVPIVKIITCKVIITHQFKSALITGTLDYYDNRNSQLIKTNPITAETIFEHHAGNAVGDLDALKPETRRLVGNNPLPFPTNQDLILQAGINLKEMTKNIIWSNKGILKP
jgi:tetratricopeptide (TPR) repeat protein